MAKKILAMVLALTMILSLAACSGSDKPADAGTKQNVVESEESASDAAETVEGVVSGDSADLTGKKVGFSALLMSSEFFTDMSNQMEEYFTARGMEYNVADANGNAQTQITTVENFVSMGMDYIICFVVDASSITDSLIAARNAGAFIIVIGTVLDNPDAFDVCISISQYESGYQEAVMAAAWIDANFPDAEDGSVKVAILENSENEDAVARCQGLEEIANLTSKATVVEIQETTQTEGAAAGQSKTEMFLLNNPDLHVILTYGTDQGQGANEAIMADASIDKETFAVFTIDTAEFIRTKVRESETNDSVIRGTIMLGEGTPMTCYNLMDGSWMERVVDKVYSEQCIQITPDTLADYYPGE